jgi:acyl-coenzyme A synthetase/AMP-(fatty) acid ligase
VFELFAPLTSGGKVILAQDAVSLPSLPAASEVTLINTVPSAVAELLSLNGIPSSVVTINLAGELLKTSLVQQIYAQTSAKRVYDLYGPSEDTTYSTFALRTCEGPTTIGRPIANAQCYILDFDLQTLPVGVVGELHIGGQGLARGYHNRPDLTAERFVPNPFSAEPGARLYKTGDLARYLPDGNIEFLGRIDQQVKVRGFRIELGEIEAVLVQHPAIAEVVAVAREDVPGEKCLVAYVVPREEPAPTTSELRRFLKQKLPDYMVPGAFVFLSSLPLTPNGKVNRSALPAPDQSRPELNETFVAPRSPAEETVAGIWQNILGRRKIGIHDNFFDLGGHSLLATQVVSRLSEVFHIDLPLRILFEKPTVAEFAAVITEHQPAPMAPSDLSNLLADLESMSDEQALESAVKETREANRAKRTDLDREVE